MIIRIKSNQRKQKLALKSIERRLRVLLERLDLPEAELSVLFTGERAMRRLNRTYRGIDRPTDVLSFPFREGAYGDVRPDLLGDIVVCVPVAERQSREDGETLPRAVDRLLVHGLLHLLGYDHEQGGARAAAMRRRERRLLTTLHR